MIDYSGPSPAATIRNYLASGRNGGRWNGNSLRSSSATSRLGVSYADNAVLGLSSFMTETVDSTSILVKYTFDGDANLDGMVDLKDLYAMAIHWSTSSDVWTSGDLARLTPRTWACWR